MTVAGKATRTGPKLPQKPLPMHYDKYFEGNDRNMTLANMYEQGVHNLIAYCHNDACRYQAVIDVSSYPADTPVPCVSVAGEVRDVWWPEKKSCGGLRAERALDQAPSA